MLPTNHWLINSNACMIWNNRNHSFKRRRKWSKRMSALSLRCCGGNTRWDDLTAKCVQCLVPTCGSATRSARTFKWWDLVGWSRAQGVCPRALTMAPVSFWLSFFCVLYGSNPSLPLSSPLWHLVQVHGTKYSPLAQCATSLFPGTGLQSC